MQKNKMVKKKERPILFKLPMVQAILAGNKTQTRRVVNFPLSRSEYEPSIWQTQQKIKKDVKNKDGKTIVKKGEFAFMSMTIEGVLSLCPYGQVGDKLWVRETWQHANFPCDYYTESVPVFYRADYKDDPHGYDGEKSPEGKYRHWKPSIFMPRAASRILLEITNVRVERLRDISEQDAIAEGIKPIKITCSRDGEKTAYKAYDWPNENITKNNPIDSYFSLWQSINGRESLDANPWVWVIEFKRVGGAT